MAGVWDDYPDSFGGMDAFPDTGNQTVVFPVSDQPIGQPSFDIPYEATCASLYWTLALVQLGFACWHLFVKRDAWALKRWPLFFMLVAFILMTCICESIAWGYSVNASHGHTSDATYLAYVFFWHASSASFLVLLLALSSGYCITRGDLEDLKPKVFGIPTVVFVAGVASDFTFVYVESTQSLSAAADRYDIVQMTAWEEAVWFLGSLANIMSFIFAWIYIFDSTQQEVKALDAANMALQRKPVEEESPSNGSQAQRRQGDEDTEEEEEDGEEGRDRVGQQSGRRGGRRKGPARRNLGTVSQRTGLLYGMEEASSNGSRRRVDVESGRAGGSGGGLEDVMPPPQETETLADRMEYTVRKTLLMRFYYGVCGYLVASILVILLPAFFNSVVQNVIVVLQFVVKFIFTLVLMWTFRPAKDSPYLQIGLSENDTDNDLGQLDTELTVTDTQAERAGAGSSQGAGAPANGNGSTHMPAAAASTPQLPVSSLPVSTLPGIGPQVPTFTSRVGRGGYATLAPDAQSAPGPAKAGPQFTLTDDDDFR